MRIGFDNDRYLKIQSEHIKERINQFGDKLYLEFGGKLFDDYHASRVLPGFAPDSKLQMLMQLADMAEIVIVISAADIEKNKVRGDLGITYDVDVVRLIGEFEKRVCMWEALSSRSLQDRAVPYSSVKNWKKEALKYISIIRSRAIRQTFR